MRDKKEMLSVTKRDDGRLHVRINSSSLDLILTCLKKANFRLVQELESPDEAVAPLFGKAIHKALEHWYSSPVETRTIPEKAAEHARLIAQGARNPEKEDVFGNAVLAFRNAGSALFNVPSDDKRSLENGSHILTEYFKRYTNDGFSVLTDEKGPLVERGFSFLMHEDDRTVVEYFGTIDCILYNPETKVTVIADHKTTSALGTEFYKRLKPNHQYTGYVFGARKGLGIETNLFMINGIQVAKTKVDFARQITERTEEDYGHLVEAVTYAVSVYLNSMRIDSWPMSAPNPCTMYGGCTYYDICHVPKKIQGSVIRAKFPKEEVSGNQAQ